MKVELVVEKFNVNHVNGVLHRVDGRETPREISAKFKVEQEAYEKLYRYLDRSCIVVEVEGNTIVEVYDESPSPRDGYRDSSDVIVEVVEGLGGSCSKQELYDKYCELTGKSERTAQDHLQEALRVKDELQEDGYYDLEIIR